MFQWDEACECSFLEMKDKVISTPIRALPEDLEGYVVYCDASGVWLRCILIAMWYNYCIFFNVDEKA